LFICASCHAPRNLQLVSGSIKPALDKAADCLGAGGFVGLLGGPRVHTLHLLRIKAQPDCRTYARLGAASLFFAIGY
jgi:hypothetical protein